MVAGKIHRHIRGNTTKQTAGFPCEKLIQILAEFFLLKKQSKPLGLDDKISSFAALMNKDESDKSLLDRFFWESVCENIFSELNFGQSGPEDPKWAEAGVIAGLVDFDLEKALAEATAALPDPKSWETLKKSEEKAMKEAA